MLTPRPPALRRGALLSVALVCLLLWPAPALGQNPVFVGVYPDGHLSHPTHLASTQELEAWIGPTGPRLALIGEFLRIESAGPELAQHLNAIWNNGWIPFIKLFLTRTADEIASGAADAQIAAWGQHFAEWTQGGTKRAFVVPLPEMNGEWIPYYSDPATFKLAYRQMRNIIRAQLQAAGVPQNAISWVYGPNGWGLPGDEFELFYPGHNDVDVISFTSYNWGRCPPWHNWDMFEVAFEPFLHRMRAMGPGKPIFVAETAVIDDLNNPMGDRNEWFRDSYARLAAFPALRGIVYFNLQLETQPNLPNCPEPDFRVHVPGTDRWQGFKDALTTPGAKFGYWAPTSPQVASIVFAPTVPHVFDDVHPIHPFAAEPGDVDYSSWIHTLAASGITTGCGANPPRFCPAVGVSRAQMAVFLLKAKHGSAYTPPPATGTRFGDVPADHFFGAWIEQLAAEGITSGCSGGNYCPNDLVTRAQMAVFLLKANHAGGYSPPPALGTVFSDVPASNFFAPWIEQLAASGVTGGCGGGTYCPDASISRQQMAVFLVRAFGLVP